MIENYLSGCLLLRTCARLLRLPARATVTALCYTHEVHRSDITVDASSLAAFVTACLFLASKVEEISLSNNHLINVVNIVAAYKMSLFLHPCYSTSSQALTAGQSSVAVHSAEDEHAGHSSRITDTRLIEHIKDSQVLTGQAYYTAKAAMLRHEQQILRALRFQLNPVEQPYTYLFSILKTTRAPAALVKTSVCVMNDVGTFSAMFLDHPPLYLAVACVHVASHLNIPDSGNNGSGVSMCDILSSPQPNRSEGPSDTHDAEYTAKDILSKVAWFEALGVRDADVENLGHAVIDVLMSEVVNSLKNGTQQ
jgi:hypothetical protein